MKRLLGLSLLVFATGWGTMSLFAQAPVATGPFVVHAQHAVAPPLRETVPIPPAESEHRVLPLRMPNPVGPGQGGPDGALQTSILPLVGTSSVVSFPGLGNGSPGFTVQYAPPDTNGAVGGPKNGSGLSSQFVQWVNVSFAVFETGSGAELYGPTSGSTLFAALGATNPCATRNDGDPIAQYDKLAQRWVMLQPVFASPYQLCVAVSTTSDVLAGTWNVYDFAIPNNVFPDYPKLAVWSDAYYVSYNQFNGNSFAGAAACALDRTKMLAGSAATMQCFPQSTSVASLLPSDLDGTTAPPSGSPDYFINFGSNSLNVWKFHSDFTTPANSTFTGPTNIPVAAFSEACGGGTCIPQSGTKQQLDSLADRLMYRLAYRNNSGAESLVVNHSVAASTGRRGSSGSGIRWYELQISSGTPSLSQQGTFAPDSNYRWMGSIAMDKVGDIAVGYSVSGSQIHPGIAYTGRVPTDTPGTLESEATIIDGTGSQLRNLNRWGDYSSMAVDPLDNCTFWYTTEYLQANGTFNWSTQIAHFKFPGCH